MSRSMHPRGSRCDGVEVEQYNVVIGREPFLQRRMWWWSYGSWLGWGMFTVVVLSALSICLLVGIQSGSRDPRTELQDLTLDNLTLTADGSDTVLTPWLANANISVTFQARNPSTVVGFKHRYLYTCVSAFYEDTLWGGVVVPPFSQGHKSSGNVTAIVVVHNQRVNQSSGGALQRSIRNQWDIALLIRVDARVKMKAEMSIGHERRWFNLTCLVNVSMPATLEAGRMLSRTCSKSMESAKD